MVIPGTVEACACGYKSIPGCKKIYTTTPVINYNHAYSVKLFQKFSLN